MTEPQNTPSDFKSFVASVAATAAATLSHVEGLLQPGDEKEPQVASPDDDVTSEPGSQEAASEAPSPEQTAERVRNGLASSRQLIDTLAMLEQKTKGNLSTDEQQFLQEMLTQLRFSYVRLADREGGR